jgi:hypothetical protein
MGELVYSQSINLVEELTVWWQLVPKFGKIVKFFKGSVYQWRGGHASRTTFSAFTANKVPTLKVKVFCPFFRHNSMSVSNFLRGNRFRCGFFTISLSFALH